MSVETACAVARHAAKGVARGGLWRTDGDPCREARVADEGVGKRASAAGGRHERETADAAGPEPWGTPLASPPPWDLDAPIASPPFHARRFPPETSTNLVGCRLALRSQRMASHSR